jgi:hypothetical protein
VLSIYKNQRTNHTFQTEKRGNMFAIIERDYMGEQPQIMGTFSTRTRAQDVLDTLADEMDWKFCGKQDDEP